MKKLIALVLALICVLSLKTWEEPCGARAKRRCGVMTAAPAETRSVPSVRARGKYGE